MGYQNHRFGPTFFVFRGVTSPRSPLLILFVFFNVFCFVQFLSHCFGAGITKGLGGKHKWAKQENDPVRLQRENEAVGGAAVGLVTDVLSLLKDVYKPEKHRAMSNSAQYLKECCSKVQNYADGGPNEAALKSTVKVTGDEIMKLLNFTQPTPKQEVSHLIKVLAAQVDAYMLASNVDARTVCARKMEQISGEFTAVAKGVHPFIPDITHADTLVMKCNQVPLVTKDMRELNKSAQFFTDSTQNAAAYVSVNNTNLIATN
jgi:hypothetical protein